MKYYLTYDVGTTAVKTCLFDETLRLAAITNEEYRLETSPNGFVELSAEEYFLAVCRGTEGVLKKSGVAGSAVCAVGITTQGETLIPIDENGSALRKAIVWLDARAERQAAALAERFSPDAFYKITGLPEINGYLPLAKLVWLRENEPEVYRKTDKFLLLEDYLIFRLTGLTVTEKSLVCSTGWFSLQSDGYSAELLRAAGVDEGKLPQLTEPGTLLSAPVKAELREKFGFSDELRVVTGAMDQTAGALGAGNILPGRVTETTGTALAIGATVEAPNLDDENRVTVYRHVKKGLYLMMPFCMTAGMFLKWFKDGFCGEELAEAERRGVSVYDVLNEKAAAVKPGCGGLIALPYLSGSLQPHANPNMRAVFFGAGLDTDRAAFARSVYEGVAYMLRENLELLSRSHHLHVRELYSLGGGAKSALWRKIKADVTGVRVGLPAQTESTSLGAAMLCAAAAGGFASVEAAAETAQAGISWCEPQKNDAYEKNYQKYCELLDRLDSLF